MSSRLALVVPLALFSCAKTTTPSTEPVPVNPLSTEGITASVESSLDRSVEPCDDFYTFACGGWLDANEMPADRSRISRGFTQLFDHNQEIVRQILDDAAAGTIQADARLGTYFGACMDTEAIDARGAAPLKKPLELIGTIEDAASLMSVLGQLPMADAFFGGYVNADLKDPTYNVLHLAQGGLGLPEKAYYLPDDEEGEQLYKDYQAHVGKMLELFGLDKMDAEPIVRLETKLAKASRSAVELRDVEKMHDRRDREGLQALTPDLPWTPFFTAVGHADLDEINIMTPEFFPAAAEIIAAGDWETIRAYVSWRLIDRSAPYLSSEIEAADFAFFGTRLSGQQEQEPRWKTCVSRTDGQLGDLLGQAYVDRAFAGDSKDIALQMITDIEAAFEAGLPDLDWMDNTTRKGALAKLATIQNKIGYPDKWDAYVGLDVSGSYFDQQLAIEKWSLGKELDKVGNPVDKSEWYMSPPTVNAYYNPPYNEIVFPAGILQPPFFSSRFPVAMNYGAMGMVMGHEVTHGFDDEGRKFAPDGSMKEWWAPEVSERFEERAQCVVELYNGYEVQPDLFVQGELTLGENIADMGGIRLAHRAYTTWQEAGGSDPQVAGFTGEQLLFIAYAQGWCTEMTPEMERQRVATDPHSPSRFRVNGPLSQLRAFGDAFSCEAGDPMRPTDICEVW